MNHCNRALLETAYNLHQAHSIQPTATVSPTIKLWLIRIYRFRIRHPLPSMYYTTIQLYARLCQYNTAILGLSVWPTLRYLKFAKQPVATSFPSPESSHSKPFIVTFFVRCICTTYTMTLNQRGTIAETYRSAHKPSKSHSIIQ